MVYFLSLTCKEDSGRLNLPKACLRDQTDTLLLLSEMKLRFKVKGIKKKKEKKRSNTNTGIMKQKYKGRGAPIFPPSDQKISDMSSHFLPGDFLFFFDPFETHDASLRNQRYK